MLTTKTITTQVYDLDWNRHVTSRTYERFSYAARMEILANVGYPMKKMLAEGMKWIPQLYQIRFLSQQFQDANLEVKTKFHQDSNGICHFIQMIQDLNQKPVCEIKSTAILVDKNKKILLFSESQTKDESTEPEFLLKENLEIRPNHPSIHPLTEDMYIPFSDMNCFWNLSGEAIWKFFEEGRFLFFQKVVDLEFIQKIDTTTFFMGGEIEILELPEPGTKIQLSSWIDSIEKIRFYFRQDITDGNGKLYARMKDEQLFVGLSTSRPKRAPAEFIEKTKAFIRPNEDLAMEQEVTS